MNSGRTAFSQLMDYFPRYEFRQCVARYNGNYRAKSFSCLDQFICMAFAQLTFRESLRDIECCLRAMKEKLYHMGMRTRISRSTLADANEKRDWRIYGDFAQVLIHTARQLYADEDLGIDLDNTIYALDALQLTCAYPYFHGHDSEDIKGQSNYIHYLTFMAISLHLLL